MFIHGELVEDMARDFSLCNVADVSGVDRDFM
jgi:hypothetical protein